MPIGSLGKAFTMTLLGYYLNREGLRWDTKLQDFAAEFGGTFDFPNDHLTNQLRISDLLTHRTGLSSVADYGFIAGYPPGTTKEVMTGKLTYVPIQANAGEQFIYNNMMYMVLGYVTELMGDKTWEELMTKKLLHPVGMKSSPILDEPNDVLHGGVAKPYILRDGTMQPGDSGIYNITPLEPAGSIMSTGLDMAKWMQFVLNNATTHTGKALLEAGLFEQALTEQFTFPASFSNALSIRAPTFPVDDVTTGYGYAWFTSTYRDHKRVWHSGGLFSYISMIWLYPDEKIGLFASTNGNALPSNSGTALKTLFWYLSDLLLGYEPWLDLETACSFPRPWSSPETHNNPPHPIYMNDNLKDFVGTYISDLLPKVTVTLQGVPPNTLKFEMNRIKGTLFPTTDVNVLSFEMSDPWEYAIERVVTANYSIRYPVVFTRSTKSDTLDDVTGFSITLGVTVPFKSSGYKIKALSVNVLFLLSLALFYKIY